MSDIKPKDLVAAASALARPYRPSEACASGSVASALLTEAGNVYTGICVDTECSLGFCAEHAAVAEMLKARESHIRMIVAVGSDGAVLPPCGRCRELIWQVSPANRSTLVVLGDGVSKRLGELLPDR
jgi:cytidine deaminase